ncbi:unnamed protein product [Bubo scandiacus]
MSKAWRRGRMEGGEHGEGPGAARGSALRLRWGGGEAGGGHGSHKKKHKKHKKKHKKKHHHEAAGPPPAPEPAAGLRKPQLKLKIKLGGQILGHQEYRAWLDEDSNLDPSPLPDLDSESCFPAREEEEEEEERWLDALEKGELDDNGELKKEVDESLLTARQKALLHKQQSQPLLELPMGYKAKELTEEMLVKREERARKRRLQAAKKAEENKNQTIERLTKTNKAKVKTLRERKAKQAPCPVVHYCNATDRITVSFPVGMALPLLPRPGPPPCPPPVLCGVAGCSNHKRYCCSRTGLPLCSLACYRRNLQLQEAAA